MKKTMSRPTGGSLSFYIDLIIAVYFSIEV